MQNQITSLVNSDPKAVWRHKRVKTSYYRIEKVLDGIVYYRALTGSRQLCLVEEIWLREYEQRPA